jgi:hypothetical protein
MIVVKKFWLNANGSYSYAIGNGVVVPDGVTEVTEAEYLDQIEAAKQAVADKLAEIAGP